jgi:hypothetical protein
MAVQELIRTRPGDPALGKDEPKEAHLVQGKDKVVEAAVLGTPVEALCGKIFVPSRDPKSLPKCQRCVEIFRGRGPEDPDGLS